MGVDLAQEVTTVTHTLILMSSKPSSHRMASVIMSV